MRASILICLLLAGCAGPRVQVQPPDTKVIVSDRVTELAQLRGVDDPKVLLTLMEKMTPEVQRDVMKELIASRERLAQQALQRESEKGSHWIEVLKVTLQWAAAIGIGTLVTGGK